MRQQLAGGVQYGSYSKPLNRSVCSGTSVRPRSQFTVDECLLTEADYRAFLRLIVKDRFNREFGSSNRFSQEQYLTALDEQLKKRIPLPLQGTPCTKITAFIPEVGKNLPQQGNYEFMPNYARQATPTKTKPYWKVVKKLGEGSVGLVYIVVNSQNENFALKFQVVTPGEPRFTTVEDEVKLQNFFANLNLAPRVVGLTSVQLRDPRKTQIKIIVMEPIDFTLDDMLCNPNSFPPSWVNAVAEQVKELILMLHKYGITHGDLHPGNIGFMYDANTKELKLRLIDFGQSSNRRSVSKVDALQFAHAISREFMGVPSDIEKLLRAKITEAGRAIYGNNFALPTRNYRDTFIQAHRAYSRAPEGALGYVERPVPTPNPNFPAWFKT